MRWPVFCLVAIGFLVIEVSVGQVLVVQRAAPGFLAALATYLALFAPRLTALWAAWWLGVLLDLVTDLPHGAGRAGPMLGPNALGFVFATYAILQVRAMLIRRHFLTIAVAAFVHGLLASLVRVFLLAAHGWYEPAVIHWAEGGPLAEFTLQIAEAAYTAVLAGLLAPVLLWSEPAWGFRHQPGRMVV